MLIVSTTNAILLMTKTENLALTTMTKTSRLSVENQVEAAYYRTTCFQDKKELC